MKIWLILNGSYQYSDLLEAPEHLNRQRSGTNRPVSSRSARGDGCAGAVMPGCGRERSRFGRDATREAAAGSSNEVRVDPPRRAKPVLARNSHRVRGDDPAATRSVNLLYQRASSSAFAAFRSPASN